MHGNEREIPPPIPLTERQRANPGFFQKKGLQETKQNKTKQKKNNNKKKKQCAIISVTKKR